MTALFLMFCFLLLKISLDIKKNNIFVHEFFHIQSYFSKVDSQKLTFTKLLKYHQIVCQHGVPASPPQSHMSLMSSNFWKAVSWVIKQVSEKKNNKEGMS